MEPFSKLREYLEKQSAGKVDDRRSLEKILSECWDDLAGSDAEATTSDKLVGRTESVHWHPPKLTFVPERHGGTVMGSTRAELHHWTIDIDVGRVCCDPNHGYRQLKKRDASLDIEPLVTEVVTAVASGLDDSRIKWLQGRDTVRVLVGEFIVGQFKHTGV